MSQNSDYDKLSEYIYEKMLENENNDKCTDLATLREDCVKRFGDEICKLFLKVIKQSISFGSISPIFKEQDDNDGQKIIVLNAIALKI